MEAFREVLPYLDDCDVMNLLKTCKELYALRDKVQWNFIYDIEHVQHLPFIGNIKNISMTIDKEFVIKLI